MLRKLFAAVVTVGVLGLGYLTLAHYRYERTWESLDRIPAGSQQYANAQRLLGYNYYGHDKGDWQEAKRHVDLALKASPDDPKVLEDAGRVYVRVGLVSEGETMLKAANTNVANQFLAARRGT